MWEAQSCPAPADRKGEWEMADIQLIRELTDAFGLYEEEGLFREKAGGYAGCASGRMRIYGAVDP